MDDKARPTAIDKIVGNGGEKNIASGPQQTKLMIAVAILFGCGIVSATVISLWAPENGIAITVVGSMVMTAVGFLLTHFKQQVVEEKLKENTLLTIEAGTEAKQSATLAASLASENATTAIQSVKDQINENASAVTEIRTAINGRMEQLIQSAREAAFAEGMAAGKLVQDELKEHISKVDQTKIEMLQELKRTIEEVKEKQEEHARNIAKKNIAKKQDRS